MILGCGAKGSESLWDPKEKSGYNYEITFIFYGLFFGGFFSVFLYNQLSLDLSSQSNIIMFTLF